MEMATWKWESGRDADDVDGEIAPDSSVPRDENAPQLFGKFRRASTGDGRNGSIAEMWGFGGEERVREERRKRFWGTASQDPRADMEDPQPWLQFRRNDGTDEPEYDQAVEEAWDEAGTDELDPGTPAYAEEPPTGTSTRGWQNFLVDGMRSTPADAAEARLAAASFVAPRREPAPPPVMPLAVEMPVDLRIAVGLCTALSKDWRTIEPTVADVVIRSLARAIRREPSLSQFDDEIAVMDLGSDTGIGCLLAQPASKPFKMVVAELAESPAEPVAQAVAGFTDYGLLGIHRATPRLGPGQRLSLALGARVFDPTHANESLNATLTLAYDGNLVSDGAAARVLARIRHLVETPEDLLAG